MSLQKQLDYSGAWASKSLMQAIVGRETEITPLDSVTLFAVLLCLHDAPASRYDGLPVIRDGIAVDTTNKVLNLTFYHDGRDTDKVIERFLAAVGVLNFGTSWTINLHKTDSKLAIRTMELTDGKTI